jgi:hypothetical protein
VPAAMRQQQQQVMQACQLAYVCTRRAMEAEMTADSMRLQLLLLCSALGLMELLSWITDGETYPTIYLFLSVCSQLFQHLLLLLLTLSLSC